MNDDVKANKTIDLKGQVCPYTFVRSKLAIEKMHLGEVLEIIFDHKPATENVPKSMENEGQKVLKIDQTGEKEWHVFIRKDKTSDAQRASLVAAAGYPSVIADSPLLGIYIGFLPAVGLLLASLVMRKGTFSKALAFVGVIASICGILAGIGPIFLGALDTLQYINAGLAMIWFFFVGLKLNKLGQ